MRVRRGRPYFAPTAGGDTRDAAQTAHFDCLGRWLTPDDPERGRLVESTSGLVAIELKCPFCKKALSRVSRSGAPARAC